MKGIKPCPFCGESSIEIQAGCIYCLECGCSVESEKHIDTIRAWNTRNGIIEPEYNHDYVEIFYKCNYCQKEAVQIAYDSMGINCHCDKGHEGCGAIYPIEFHEQPKLDHSKYVEMFLTPERN